MGGCLGGGGKWSGTHVRDAFVVKPCQCVISNNKRHIFSLLMVNCPLQDISKGTVNVLQL